MEKTITLKMAIRFQHIVLVTGFAKNIYLHLDTQIHGIYKLLRQCFCPTFHFSRLHVVSEIHATNSHIIVDETWCHYKPACE